MKSLLFAMLVGLIMVGCGGSESEDNDPMEKLILEGITPSKKADKNFSMLQRDAMKIAIGFDKLDWRGKGDQRLLYLEAKGTPYAGWAKLMHINGHVKKLAQYKGGQPSGILTKWYENGQKEEEAIYREGKKDGPCNWWYANGQNKKQLNYKDGKLMEAVVWKLNGEKCTETYLKDGNGIVVEYKEGGTGDYRFTYKDGERVKD